VVILAPVEHEDVRFAAHTFEVVHIIIRGATGRIWAVIEHNLRLVAIDGGTIAAHGWRVLDDFVFSLLLDKIALRWPEQVDNWVEPNYVGIETVYQRKHRVNGSRDANSVALWCIKEEHTQRVAQIKDGGEPHCPHDHFEIDERVSSSFQNLLVSAQSGLRHFIELLELVFSEYLEQ
jgi:hypothetical protein